jgi:hypothetical protein
MAGIQGGRDMFGKKDTEGGVATPEKAKKVSPVDVLIGQLDSLEAGKEMTFRLGEIYVKPFISVARNATGKKFTVYQDGKDAANKPLGKRGKFWDADKAKDIVHWIVEREGTVYRG